MEILGLKDNTKMLLNNRAVSTHKCPVCGSYQVRRAHRAGGLERIISLVNLYPYHCLQCPSDTRFHRFGKR
jgi:predicted RNA-binding Zn-ribbon protein involved in translation (DUF1610 family)